MEKILEQINQASLKLLEQLAPLEAYETIVREAVQLVGADEGLILLNENDRLVTVYGSSPAAAAVVARKRGYAYKAYKENKAFVVGKDDIIKHDPKSVSWGVRSWIFIPLSYRNDSIGALVVRSFKDNVVFTEREMAILTLFGSMATLAIKKAQQFNETKKALEIRDMFISMAAHELRTPLTSINGYIQLLHNKLATRDGVEGKWIKELYEESKRMTTLVKELLEVNRLKTGQVQFMWQECSVLGIIQQSIREINAVIPDRVVEFDNKLKVGEDIVIGDATKLTKVFVNIIDNGLKYSAKDTFVQVSAVAKGGFIVVTIKDFGKGIDQKDLPHIFEGHHQGGGGEEGMGIGLFFVESVIRQHHATIGVKSKLKKGTIFTVKLPKAKL